jgi:hypothetical protein
VNAEVLRRLAEILGETSHELEYGVKFSDGANIRSDDIEKSTQTAQFRPTVDRFIDGRWPMKKPSLHA